MNDEYYDPAGDERNDPKRQYSGHRDNLDEWERDLVHQDYQEQMKETLKDKCPHCGQLSAAHRDAELDDHHYLAGYVTVGNVDRFHDDMVRDRFEDLMEYNKKIENADVTQKFNDIVAGEKKRDEAQQTFGNCASCDKDALTHTIGEWAKHGNAMVFKRKRSE